ncbi:MAG: DEAD/DEAH box helicase [Deltaproteobacteria bacterium]|nr:DEAD/DEAH box helicase [Deltaproteobacteria bacterium]
MTITSTDGPAVSFDSLGLSAPVRRAISEAGYKNPTSVQAAVFGPIAAGRDTLVQSKTGSGKTAAFALPILDRRINTEGGVQAMVLCPTRELAIQFCGEVARLGKYRNIKAVAIYGGASMERQVDEIQAGAQIAVGTPGRMLDHLKRRTLDASNIRVVCLDEADEMLSMGFAEDLNAILEFLPRPRQTLLFSATMPESIRRLASRQQRDAESILLSADQIAPDSIDHFVYYVGLQDRLTSLMRVMDQEQPDRAIIFCNTRDETTTVSNALRRKGLSVDYLSGELDQGARERVLASFRDGQIQHLVATDVAARGIDVSTVTHVVNYGFPVEAESYVHRTGRTGRAGRRGVAISLFAPADVGNLYMLRLSYGIKPIERALPSAEEERTRREVEQLDLLRAQTLTSKVGADSLSLARRVLAHDHAEAIIAALIETTLRSATRDALGAPERAPVAAPVAKAAKFAAPAQPAPIAAEAPAAETPVAEAPTAIQPAAEASERPASSRPRRAPRNAPENRPRRIDVHGGEDPGLEPETIESDMGEVRVALGRRDGVRGGDLARMVRDRAGIAPKDIGTIKLYDRFALIPVRADQVDTVIEALESVSIEDRPLSPERGRLSLSVEEDLDEQQ